MAKDPICGMVVDPEKAEFKTEKDGQTYYFCSESCKHKFDKTSANDTSGKDFSRVFWSGLLKLTKKNSAVRHRRATTNLLFHSINRMNL